VAAQRADAVRNRELLISAAAELFAARGVDVPLEEVAQHAQVSIGTLYNHFPNRGALLDAVLPARLAEVDRLAEAALADPDPWQGFVGFLEALFGMQARDRAINDAISRSPVGAVDVAAECGRSGTAMQAVLARAVDEGVLRDDYGPDDLAVLVQAMSRVIAVSEGEERRWRRHLAFVLDGLRATSPADVKTPRRAGGSAGGRR
jgi:AcrR family transcriptional regulator